MKDPRTIIRDGKTFTWRFNIAADNIQETATGVLILSVNDTIEGAVKDLAITENQELSSDFSQVGIYLPKGTSLPSY